MKRLPFIDIPFIGVIFFFCLLFNVSFQSFAQETNSQLSGIVKSEKNELLDGATFTLVHTPTNNTFITQSRHDGRFYFSNLKPGGPYTLTISFVGYETLTRPNLFIELSNNETKEIILTQRTIELGNVVASASSHSGSSGIETSINNHKLASLPTISRNLQDFVRLVPQAKVNGDGMMSLAGQNNKFNAFFIDGANNNDILGIAMSGTNGGQTNTPPISIDALDEVKVLLAPYHVLYSNFTGGSINAITKSGSNEVKGSAWYFFRNEKMAGRSPVPVEKPDSSGSSGRPRLSHFFNQTFGLWTSGPIVKNKLFFFISLEKQLERRPQPFNFSEYSGASSREQLNALANTLRQKYHYEPGSFLESKEEVNATRTIFKADWNPSVTDKLTASYRYNLAERTSPRTSTSTLLAFENNGFVIPARTHAASMEWKHYFKRGISNRLLVTYTHQKDDRRIMGTPFPQVTISDGKAMIYLGSHAASQFSLFQASDANLLNIVKLVKGKQNISMGADLNFTKISDLQFSSLFGNYEFRSLTDLFTNQYPSNYTRSFLPGRSLVKESLNDATRYHSFRFGCFINDEIHLMKNLDISIGLRVDGYALPQSYAADTFLNHTASKVISAYYNLEGALSGKAIDPNYQVAPRLGFTYNLPHEKLTFRGGAGIFSGRILNIWSSAIYQSAMGIIDIKPQAYGMHFIADPSQQPSYTTLGLTASTARGAPVLVSSRFKYPAVFRTSLSAEKRWNKSWSLTAELLFTQNIHEWKITNVNLLPPSQRSSDPGSRFIYTSHSYLPLMPDGSNPYTNIFLLSNNHDRKGYAYNLSMFLDKAFTKSFSLMAGYSFGRSRTLFEPYAFAGPIETQWVQSETVNGRNLTSRSVSDLDPGHRIFCSLFKKVDYWNHKAATSLTLFYNGQSGQPYSYVYNGSMINDHASTRFDLIYIPTEPDLMHMIFIPVTVKGKTYTAQQQKQLLNDFIENDRYLRSHRGRFAERNGARLPFTHTLDIRVQQDFSILVKKKRKTISVIYDVFNLLNMLHKNWGRTYSLAFDNYRLITFAGLTSDNTLTPQYQFSPMNGKVYSLQPSTAPGSSARWISQLGFRISF